MKKYKLIKTYPGSPVLGFEIEKVVLQLMLEDLEIRFKYVKNILNITQNFGKK